MLQLNILSPRDKETFRYERARRILARFAARFFFLVLLAAGFLLPSYFMTVLQEKDIALEESQLLKDSRIAQAIEMERAIETSSREIRLLSSYVTKKASAGSYVESLITAASSGVIFNAIRADQTKKRVEIEGLALKRDDLLKTITAAEALPFVAEVKSPISNIVKESNSPFHLEIILK